MICRNFAPLLGLSLNQKLKTMNYYIETYQDGKQLLGSDFTTIVKNAGKIKLQNALKMHEKRLKSLEILKPSLMNGYEIKVVSQSWLQHLAR